MGRTSSRGVAEVAVTKKQTGVVKNTPKNLERFRDKFVPEPNSGCWLWCGSTTDTGYGRVKVNGKIQRAHRVSYELHNGLIPEGLNVCHTCDTPLCVNPDHLFLGTQQDNITDMIQKGRAVYVKGASNGRSKLTEEQVWEVYHAEGTQVEIAAQYEVTQQLVSLIKRKKNWRHIHE